ncbi:MAG: hypothetical protein ACI8S6_003015 [Myxococcota bacterium]|jgi:hypothetical protein
MSMLWILAAALLGVVWVLRSNAHMLAATEDWSEADGPAELLRLHRRFDRPEQDWQTVLTDDGVEVGVGWSDSPCGRRVRVYRAISVLDAEAISVDRIRALLDGGFLDEAVWFKDDYQGGQRLRQEEPAEETTSWIAQYISDLKMPPLLHRDFVYRVLCRELPPSLFAQDAIRGEAVRQVILVYRSVSWPAVGPRLTRAIQLPSLDRVTLLADGRIQWEHIMTFHLGGVFPLWLTNQMTKPAAKVLWHEAVNMRAHCDRAEVAS